MAMGLYCDSSDAARDTIVPGRKAARKKGLVLGVVGDDYGPVSLNCIFIDSHSSRAT